MDDDQHADIRHALRNQLTVMRGWAQLILREGNKPIPDTERLRRYAENIDVGIGALVGEIEEHLGPGRKDADRSPL